MLGWGKIMKSLTENPAFSSGIPKCAWESRGICLTKVLCVYFDFLQHAVGLLKDRIFMTQCWT